MTDQPTDTIPTETPATPAPAQDPAPEPAKAETDWKAEARKWEQRAKENSAAAKRLTEFEESQKTEAEKLAAKAEAAEKRAAVADARAVKAEVKALADAFADREDAALNLGDLTKFVNDGEVDTAAITEALADVLERKPYLAKAAGPRTPAPDPSQGSRGGQSPDVDALIREAQAKGDWRTVMTLQNQKLDKK